MHVIESEVTDKIATGAEILSVEHLSKTYKAQDGHLTTAVADISFEVCSGEFVSIVGPSGCGKTTLLKCIAGLLPPTTGEVRLHGARVDDPPERMALVFQDYSRSLFPWMTVRQNVTFPLRRKGRPRDGDRAAVEEALLSVGLEASTFDQHPWQLSGGMQQRVAIARALAYRPELLIMDEPFASVDAQTRADLEDLTLGLRHKYDVTILLVTHDIDESVYMADRVLVLTPSPSLVAEVLAVDLPRPRSQLATKKLPEFAQLRAHVYRLIKSQGESSSPPATRSSNGKVNDVRI